MERKQLFSMVAEVIVDQMGVHIDEVIQTATEDDLGADSLDKVEVLMALEEEFDIEVSDEAAEKWRTVDDIVDYISEHAGA